MTSIQDTQLILNKLRFAKIKLLEFIDDPTNCDVRIARRKGKYILEVRAQFLTETLMATIPETFNGFTVDIVEILGCTINP